MNKEEELLQIAKEKYRKGVIFDTPGYDKKNDKDRYGYRHDQEIIFDEISISPENGDFLITVAKTTKNIDGIIYRNGQWGEITISPYFPFPKDKPDEIEIVERKTASLND